MATCSIQTDMVNENEPEYYDILFAVHNLERGNSGLMQLPVLNNDQLGATLETTNVLERVTLSKDRFSKTVIL
jgi:hypothetical protein